MNAKEILAKLLSLLMSLCVFACHEPETKAAEKPKKIEWDLFKLVLNDEHITVPFTQDTCYYFKLIKDTTYFKKHKKFRSEKQKFTLTKTERDSLLVWALDAITDPASSDDHSVSCYAGDYLALSLIHNSTEISCGYSSISAWTGLSKSMLNIHGMTLARLKRK